MDANRQLGEVSLALETYRRLLPPGIYYFAAEIQDGKPTGKTLEEREDYQRKEEESSGVTFGFYPLGFVPEELGKRPCNQNLYKYPFIAGGHGSVPSTQSFSRRFKSPRKQQNDSY